MKKFIVIKTRNDKDYELKPMTLPELVQYFNGTLEKGRSWQNERGNKKIPTKFTNIDRFIQALNDSENNAAANGFSGTYYSLKQDVKESVKMLEGVGNVTKATAEYTGGWLKEHKQFFADKLVDRILEGADVREVISESLDIR